VSVLLRQTGVFEGLVDIQINACSRDPIIAPEACDERRLGLKRGPAGTASPAEGGDCDHRVASLTHIVEVDLPFSKLLVDVAHPLFHPRVTTVRLAGHGRKRRLQLHGWIEILRWDATTARVPPTDERPDDLHILLRHRSPSIAQSQESA
jgi:hypothetical protein